MGVASTSPPPLHGRGLIVRFSGLLRFLCTTVPTGGENEINSDLSPGQKLLHAYICCAPVGATLEVTLRSKRTWQSKVGA